jgi:hypothetical protein
VLRSLPLAAAVAGALVWPRVAAATPTGRLVYSRARGAESCPDEATLRRAVAARVGYDPFFPWAQRTVVANVERHRREFVATVSLVDEQGVAHGGRQLRTSGDCAELLDAAALAIAIAIDPEILTKPPSASLPEPPPQASSVSVPAPPPAPAPPEVGAETPAEPAPKGCSGTFEASLGALASMGAAPDIAAGLSAGAALRWCDVSVGLEAQANAPATRSAQGGGDVSSLSVVAALTPCVYFGSLLGCALVQGGALRAESDGVPDRKTKWTDAVAVGARAAVLVPASDSLFVRVRSDWLANLDPIRLELRGNQVWTAPQVESSLGVDMLVRFR